MRVTVYRNYRFIDKDPIIDAVRTVVKDEKLKNSQVHAITGVATATLDNWFGGVTRKPQNATISQVTAALGYVRRDDLDKNGSLVIGFAKARSLDYQEERKKQADFLLKLGKKKTKKRKTNGHAR